MSWPDPYFSDKRVEREARDICRDQAEFTEALAFWLLVGWSIAAVELLVILYMVVTR